MVEREDSQQNSARSPERRLALGTWVPRHQGSVLVAWSVIQAVLQCSLGADSGLYTESYCLWALMPV